MRLGALERTALHREHQELSWETRIIEPDKRRKEWLWGRPDWERPEKTGQGQGAENG